MMRYSEIFERYTANNSYFKKYMNKDGDLDPYSLWPYIVRHVADSFELDEIQEWFGEHVDDLDDLNDVDPSEYFNIPDNIRSELKRDILDDVISNDPSSAPTQAHMYHDEELKRNTWLVHFSDNSEYIWREGFKRGVDQIDRLGLTRWIGNDEKDNGGYNFAFEALSQDAKTAADMGSYGEDAVLFQSAGNRCYHWNDEEYQVVFWGPDVDWKETILLKNTSDGWAVISRKDLRNGSDVLFLTENYATAAKWAIAHSAQYRKYLFGW